MNRPQDNNDRELDALLRCWQAPEPAANFSSLVLRRVRGIGTISAGPAGAGWFFPRPVLACAALFLLAVVGGVQVGVLAGRRSPHRVQAHSIPVLQVQTLAGSYLAMHEGR